MNTNPKRFPPLTRETRGYVQKDIDGTLTAVRVETDEAWVIERTESITSKGYRTPAAAQKAADKRLRQLEKDGYWKEHPALGTILPQVVRFPCTNELVSVNLSFNIEDISDNELQSLASMADWDDEVCEQMELAAFGHYLETIECIDPDPSWFPVIKKPADIWKHCSICHVRPYGKKVLVVYATCPWEEDGLEWCVKAGDLVFLGNAAFWPASDGVGGYFKKTYRQNTEDLITQIAERKKLIKRWKSSPGK